MEASKVYLLDEKTGEIFQVYMSEEEQMAVAKDPELAAHFLERAKQGNENSVYECTQVGESQQDTHGNNNSSKKQSSCQPSPEVSDSSSNVHTCGAGFPAKRWTDAATQHLIHEYANHEVEFTSGFKPNRKIWAEISEKIRKVNGLAFEPDQVENKWKNLKKTYKNIFANKAKSGNGPILWPFYALMEQVVGKKPGVRPPSITSSSNSFRSISEPPSTSPLRDIADDWSDEKLLVATQAKKRKMSSIHAKRWTDAATRHLICEYANHEAEFISDSKPNREIWAEISEKIGKVDGLVFELDQVENKWKNLKQTYKTIVANKKSYGGSVLWPFYDLMEQVINKKTEIITSRITSSSDDFQSCVEPPSASPTPDDLDECSNEPQVALHEKKRKQEPEWFMEFIDVKIKHHEEKMSLQREILAVLKDLYK